MPTQLFEARVREAPDLAIIDLHGEVNREAETGLNDAYDATAGSGAEALLLNFTDVNYINSTGIAVIVGLLARARKDNRSLVVCGLSDHYRTIFEITRLIDFMQVYPDEETALVNATDTVR